MSISCPHCGGYFIVGSVNNPQSQAGFVCIVQKVVHCRFPRSMPVRSLPFGVHGEQCGTRQDRLLSPLQEVLAGSFCPCRKCCV